MMFGDSSRGPNWRAPSLKMSSTSGESASGTCFAFAIESNRPTSLITRSIVKLMSRLPFRMTCDSVSCTKELPEEIRIAS